MFEWKPQTLRLTQYLEDGFYQRTTYTRQKNEKYRASSYDSKSGVDLSLGEVSLKELFDAWDHAEGDESITVQCD